MEAAKTVLDRVAQRDTKEPSMKVFRPRPKHHDIVRREGDVFVVAVPELERIKTRSGVAGAEVRSQIKRQLVRAGVAKALEKAGVRPGDRVRCGDIEWEW
jgi:GTP-binding protein